MNTRPAIIDPIHALALYLRDERPIPLHLAIACHDLQQAWDACQQPEPMLIVLAFADRKAMGLAVTACAGVVLEIYSTGEYARKLRHALRCIRSMINDVSSKEKVTIVVNNLWEYCRVRRDVVFEDAVLAVINAYHTINGQKNSDVCVGYASNAVANHRFPTEILTSSWLRAKKECLAAMADIVRGVAPIAPKIDNVVARLRREAP